MARLKLNKARLARWSASTLAGYVDFVHRTSRRVIEPTDVDAFLAANRPAIIAVWHGQFLMAPKVKPRDVPLAVILARHGDAEHFTKVLQRFNTTLIRGAGAGARRKDKGGAQALRAALRVLGQNVFVGMSADAPPGPAREAGEGIITLARLSGRPIIPLATATSRYHALPTWSRMTVNLPFGTLAGVFGTPIFVPRDADAEQLEALRHALEKGLDDVTRRAYELAGADPARATPPHARMALPLDPSLTDMVSTQAPGGSTAAPIAPSTTLSPPSPRLQPAQRQPTRGVALRGYHVATRILQPVVPLLLGARARRGKEDGERRPERLGIASRPRPVGRLMWLHAASVGELNAVLPLAGALRRARPDLQVLFTTGTVTSAGLAAERMAPGEIHQYVPLDAPSFVNRFLDHWRPDVAVLTESEIWPNLLLETSRRGIPMALVNARMSSRSYDRWRHMKALSQPLFSSFDVVLAQNETLARQFTEIGARRALAVGNLKIDSPPPPIEAAALDHLRQALAGRPLLVAASTHDGEERIIADAHRQLARRHPGMCTLLAPRHPERGTEVAEVLKSLGLGVAQRSLGQLPGEGTEIYVADTIGELGTFYAAAPVAFVGGSLVQHGGQNPIEAIRHGAAIISGPYWHNFRDAYEMLVEHHGALMVRNADELAAAVSRLLDDKVELQRMRAGAQSALVILAGALERTVAELLRFLPEDGELRRAG